MPPVGSRIASSIILGRDQAYIGVLIDDLVTKGTSQSRTACLPPAPSTACSCLRQDNADMRLSQLGYDICLLPERNYKQFKTKEEQIKKEISRLAVHVHSVLMIPYLRSCADPRNTYATLRGRDESLSPEVVQQVEGQRLP